MISRKNWICGDVQMTNKRFIYDSGGILIDTTTKKTYDMIPEICDLLNKQNEEIRELEKDVIKQNNEIKTLREENEVLTKIQRKSILNIDKCLFEWW